jgi:chorismate-pyruvate lyase
MSGPTVESLFALFPGPDDHLDCEVVPGEEMPEPYRGLLVHEHHMTVTVEAYHGGPVDVRILARRRDGPFYARKILLVHRATGKVVQFGIVRLDLDQTSEPVREAIVAGQTPVGRILIEHDVLRRIEPTGYLRIRPNRAQLAWFGLAEAEAYYGRLAVIHFNGEPVVEVLEIVAP